MTGVRRPAFVRVGAYVLASSMSISALSVVRAVVIARLLLPEEVGRFALAAGAISLLDALTNPSLTSALVQRPAVTSTTAETVWTAGVARGILLGAVGLVAAPALSALLHAPSTLAPMRVLALLPLLHGLAGLGPWLRVREVDLGPQVTLDVAVALLETMVSIVATVLVRSAWGMVIGAVAGAVVHLVGSYCIRGFHAALRVDRRELRELLVFGRWVYLTNALWLGITRGDDLVVGRVAGVAPLGLYRQAYRLANLPLYGLADVLQRTLFPKLSRTHQESPQQAADGFARSMLLGAGITAPLSALLVVLAPDLVAFVLGPRWLGVVTPLQILAVAAWLRTVTTPATAIFMAAGRPQLDTAVQAVSGVVLLGAIVALVGPFGIDGAAWASLGAAVAGMLVWTRAVRSVGVSPTGCARTVARRLPVAALVAGVAWSVTAVAGSAGPGVVGGSLAGVAAWFAAAPRLDRPLWDEIAGLLAQARRPVAFDECAP